MLDAVRTINAWVEMDSNHRSDDAADLQSAPFGHSGIYPPYEKVLQRYKIF